MRDTTALRNARESEPDPYRRRFPFPKWTRTITVLDEPRLFNRLPEFSQWDKPRHEAIAREYLAQRIADQRVFWDVLRRYESQFGTDGSLISGGFREHWPDYAKEACRWFSHRITDVGEKSYAHWIASGRRAETWRALRDSLAAEE